MVLDKLFWPDRSKENFGSESKLFQQKLQFYKQRLHSSHRGSSATGQWLLHPGGHQSLWEGLATQVPGFYIWWVLRTAHLAPVTLAGLVFPASFWSESLLLDRVEKPHLVEKWKVLDGGICQVTLSCSVTRSGDVSYAWYKGSNLIQTSGNITELVENIDVNGSYLYTCNVSNQVSWANHSLQLTQGCQSNHQGKWSILGYKRGWRCGTPQPGSLQRRLDMRSPDWLPQSFAALPQVRLGL